MSSLNLYDGACVRLRNGEFRIIHTNLTGDSARWPWRSTETPNGAQVSRISFTAEGCYLQNQIGHALDIVEAPAVPVDLKVAQQIAVDREHKRRIFMTDEGSTIELYEGARVQSRDGRINIIKANDDDSINDVFPWANEDGTLSWTQYGWYDYFGIVCDEDIIAILGDDDADAVSVEEDPETKKHTVTVNWDATNSDDLKEYRVFLHRSSSLPTQINSQSPEQPPFPLQSRIKGPMQVVGGYVPKKSVVKMMESICKQYDGHFEGYQLISAHEIEFKVKRYGAKLRENGKRFSTTTIVRIKVESDDNNAYIPLTKED